MTRMKAIFALAAALAFALSPLTTTGFNGFSPDQFPVPQVDPPIQPVPWAFSIWGLIYLWLIVSTGFGLVMRADDPAWDRTRWPLIASLVVGAAWIPVANISPFWATVLIWVMLATAVAALLRAPSRDRGWLAMPIGLYAGWLTAASCVATAVLVTGNGATPVVPIHAAFLLLALGIALAVLRARPGSIAYAAGVGWALVGIIVSNLSPLLWPMVAIAAVGVLLLVPLATRRQA